MPQHPKQYSGAVSSYPATVGTSIASIAPATTTAPALTLGQLPQLVLAMGKVAARAKAAIALQPPVHPGQRARSTRSRFCRNLFGLGFPPVQLACWSYLVQTLVLAFSAVPLKPRGFPPWPSPSPWLPPYPSPRRLGKAPSISASGSWKLIVKSLKSLEGSYNRTSERFLKSIGYGPRDMN